MAACEIRDGAAISAKIFYLRETCKGIAPPSRSFANMTVECQLRLLTAVFGLNNIIETSRDMRFPPPAKEPLLLVEAEVLEGELHKRMYKKTTTTTTKTTTKRETKKD